MTKKHIISLICYSVAVALLSLAEKHFGITGLAFAFCLALIFCKENIALAVIPYAVVSGLVHFDLWYLTIVASGVAVALFLALMHYRFNKKYRLWSNGLAFVVSQITVFVINMSSVDALIHGAVGVIVGLIFQYVCIVFLYPVLVRGLRYRLSSRELACVAVFVVFLAIGLNSFDIYGVKLLYFSVTVICLLLSAVDKEKILGLSVGFGLGASILSLSPVELFCCVSIGGAICVLRDYNKFLSAIGALAAFCLSQYFFGEGLNLFNVVPVAVACLVVFIPDKLFNRVKGYKQSYQGKFALRTMVNRDREEVSRKLNGVAYAFRRMQNLLSAEEEIVVKPDFIVNKICESCCHTCARFATCRQKLGDQRTLLNKLAVCAIENGRASLLDADSGLGSICIKLPKIVNLTNECVRAYQRMEERKSGIEQGKEMVIGNLGGTAELLEELAQTINTGFGFDVDMEKKIIEELGCANIIASDIAIYGNNDRITISVRDADAKKPQLNKIISDITATPMRETERAAGVNGITNLVFKPNPLYGVLYGEKSVGSEEECGDTKQAVRIADDKLMFILSDGMGTGSEAKATSTDTVSLIETFYRAGFKHKTIFTCVSKLLALRRKETFSALDVAIMDTQTGEIDFIKQGGRESYIFTGNGIDVIEGGTLPLGIIDESEPKIERRKLKNNDIVILLSDGVADKLNGTDVAEILAELSTLNPQIISDKLIENARKKDSAHADDMTAMALRIVGNVR